MTDPFDLILGGSVVQAVLPQDFDNATVNGVWANMANVETLHAVVVLAAAGTAGTGPVISFEQATDSSGTGAKALSFEEAWYLKAVDILAPTSSELWTAVDASRTSQIASWDADDVGADETELIFVARIHSEMLDTNNDFTHVRCNAVNGDSVAARLGHVMYVAKDRHYQGLATPNLLST